MGRKTTKEAKERKLRRKEENARLTAAQLKVDAANKIEDPMDLLLPFKKFDRNGVCLTIQHHKAENMDKDLKDFVFHLCKENMQSLYEASNWGWKDRDKREELFEDKARFLIVRNEENLPVAFVHFRFDIEIDEEVLYCYEIQLSESVRRKGLGKFLMQILELMAYKTEMVKVMLTTFKQNDAGSKFFKEALKYEVDESSPGEFVYEEECHYMILSKAIKPLKAKVASQKVAANGHGHVHCGAACNGAH